MNQDDVRADDAVSEAYRSLAVERAPESLDQKVLAEARQAAAAGEARRWPRFRPLAWAATIALSFALVLQYTQTGPDVPAGVFEAIEADRQAATVSEAAAADDDELAESYDAAARLPATVPAIKSEAAKRERVEMLDAMNGPSGAADLPEVAQEPEVVQESEALPTISARRDEARVSAAPGPAESSVRREARSQIASSGCNASVRTDEAAWRQCIETLIAAGRNQLARKEADEFAEAFPDAEPIDWDDR